MKYGHAVKYNGMLYPAGVEVPDSESTNVQESSEQRIDEIQKAYSELQIACEERDAKIAELEIACEERDAKIAELQELITNSNGNVQKYNKSDISRMNVDNLRKLAAELGIENAEESTGEVLKASIIEKLGL